MLNSTLICEQILEKSTEQSLKIIGEVFLPSFLLFWLGSLTLILIIGLAIIKKDLDKFFIVFIIPFLLGLVILIFTFVIPIIPKFTAGWFSGILGG